MTQAKMRTQGMPGSRRAFSQAEIAASMLLVSGLLVVALDMVGDVIIARENMSNRSVGHLLAQDLLSEALQQSYQDPDSSPMFGYEAGEGTTTRADFDDVDDYNGWSATPPERKDGTQIPDRTGWRRVVKVTYVQAADINASAISHEGFKRITVTVDRNGIETARLSAVRSAPAGWIVSEPKQVDLPPKEPPVQIE
jgi:hypothetical protein